MNLLLKKSLPEDQSRMRQFKMNVIPSSSNFFIIRKGIDVIKLVKGMSKMEVITILGEPYSVCGGNNPKNQKLVYKISSNGSTNNLYELLFRENILEWSLKK
jgi:hypothetical protein